VLVHQSPYVQLTIHHPLASAAAAVGILALIKCPNGSFTRLLCNPGLVWFGTISYGLYLWHWPVLKLLDMLLLPQGLSQTAWFLLFCAPLSVVAAWLSWRFVEAPCQSLRLRFT
jgi:peptidoglycan/LPS O-acetylase OafA/YrhL